MRKRLLSIVLILCLVAPMLPTIALPNLTAQAETTTDAFGINVDETMTEEEMAETIANNPYGTEEWFTLFSVSELALTMGTSDTRSWYTYNYNEDGDVGAITTAQSGTRTGYSEGNESNNGYSIVDTAACDAANEGQDRYTAVLAYDRGESTISLFLKDKSGNTVSNVISLGSSSTLGYLKDSEAYYNSSLLSIAAGDFDNDGVESLIVYIPYMVKGTPAIYEYTISGSADSFKLTQKSTVIGNVYSLLGVTDLSSKESGDGKARRNTPVVQLVAEDTDNDNVDELIITAGLSNVATKNISERQSKMFIYDYIQDGSETVSKGWYQSFELDTGGSDASQRLRYASSAVGNAIVDNNANTDYPEVITVGWVDSSLGASDSISHDIGTYITQCTKASKIDGTTSVGSYTATSAGNLTRDDETVSEFTEGGHYKNDDIQSLVQVSVALLDGLNSQAYVLVADTVLQYGETGWEYIYRYEYFNDDDDGIGSSIISNGAVIDVVSGNFDANIEGREQFIIATCQKRSGRNDYFYRLYTYQTPSGNSGADNSKGYQSSDYSIYKIGYTYLSLCTPDIDNDSTLAKVAETKLTYTEPEILTILEAPPYYAELDGGDIGNSTTSYSSATGSESSETTTSEVSAGFITGFEYSQDACTGLSSGGGYEASVEVGLTWEATESTSFEYEMSFDNDTGENAVVVYRRPVTTWKYELKNDESSFLTISQEGDLMTSMMTVDEYNEAAASFDNLEQITDDMLATPGDPFSYRSSALGLDNVAVYGQYATYTSGGTTAQSMTVGTGSESSFTYGLSTSFSVYGIYFGFKAGVTAGYSHSTTTSTVTTSSVTKTGAVTGNSRDGYDFNWMFGHWTMEINGQEVPVLGYFLKNVVGPPSPPVNLHAEDITSSSAKLVWDESNRSIRSIQTEPPCRSARSTARRPRTS